MDVDPVEYGTGDAFLIFGYGRWGAGTGLFVTPKVSTRTGIPRNQTVFSCELKDRRVFLKAYFKARYGLSVGFRCISLSAPK
jgi:hypothetical protein